MRLTDHQIGHIRQLANQVEGSQWRVRVFGSRLDDAALGGDIDLLLELPVPVDNPTLMAAQMSAQVSRAMHGRKVDVLLSAPISCDCPFMKWHSRKGSFYDFGK